MFSGSSCGNPLSRSSSLSNPSSASCCGSSHGPVLPSASSLAVPPGAAPGVKNCYEKDIRHIVEYFEKSCKTSGGVPSSVPVAHHPTSHHLESLMGAAASRKSAGGGGGRTAAAGLQVGSLFSFKVSRQL